jgi:hypothetical protein
MAEPFEASPMNNRVGNCGECNNKRHRDELLMSQNRCNCHPFPVQQNKASMAPMAKNFQAISWLLFHLIAFPAAALSEEAVSISDGLYGRALLDKPSAPHASVILVPGGDGVMGINPDGSFSRLRGNQLVRTRQAYVARDIATLTIDRDADIAAAIVYMRKIAAPVVLVGTSNGTRRVASAIARGVRPDATVLTSGLLQTVQYTIGSPERLPRTLVVHHRNDQCRGTPPYAVEPFKQWGGARVTVVWLEGGPGGEPVCEARSYHGFQGIDGQVVATVAQFVQGLQ